MYGGMRKRKVSAVPWQIAFWSRRKKFMYARKIATFFCSKKSGQIRLQHIVIPFVIVAPTRKPFCISHRCQPAHIFSPNFVNLNSPQNSSSSFNWFLSANKQCSTLPRTKQYGHIKNVEILSIVDIFCEDFTTGFMS